MTESFYGIEESYFDSKKSLFTSGEIAHQPEIWKVLAGYLQSKKQDIVSFLERTGSINDFRIVFTGAGSSAYIGETSALIIGKTANIKCEAVASTDIVSSPLSVLFPDIPTLLVSVARSGNSPESAGAVRCARKIVKNLWELAIVCDGNSTLAKITGESAKSMTLLMPEKSNDKGFAMTSSVTCMLLAGFAFFNICKLDEICKNIPRLADSIQKNGKYFTDISRRWAAKDYNRLIIIGSGCNRGIAREGALKTMELCAGFVNTNYESALGFRHGPKAVINDNTLTVHIISPDAYTAKYDLDLLKEIAAQKKGNKIIAVSTFPVPHETNENVVIPPVCDGAESELYAGISALVLLQMLAMFKSIHLNVTPDNPAPAGELSRVVTGVTVYDLD